ncbi:Protein of unknown function [Singulisphaera sp. GP187]|uniref:DUF1549 domain-containing protein n=1 Tax=Singulisphaera sp. GP187 TaxID=1882752 RepID=UPI00092C17D3|nr:DUF1549 domain-containing protein [Singulisphaera sp. GP187]SIO19374.1 Protein of unknown function [Singulisphaera sp. GP187]
MWARNILFIALMLGGAAALRANFFPPRSSGPTKMRTRAAVSPEVVALVDRFFRQQWTEEGLLPAKRASELTILRRIELALTGSIPSLEEIRRFEAGPPGQRLEVRLEGLLRDRRTSDYLAERLARTYVGTEGGPFLVYRRRRFLTWLSDQLLANRPYDQLVRELIAANGIWTDQPATNFVTVTYDPETKRPDAERLAGRTARAFLGVRLDCAQCHDHPFQPWKQSDFQGLAAFFGQVGSGFTGIRDRSTKYEVTNRKTGHLETIDPHVPFLPELRPTEGPLRSQLARWVTDRKNANFPRATVNRVWALMFGRALVEPIDDLPSESELPPVLIELANDFVAHGYDLQRLIRLIAATEVFQLESASEGDVSEPQEQGWAVFPITRLRPEQIVGGVIQAGSLATIDSDSPILVRLARSIGERDFVNRYGDTGEDEFDAGRGTIPQRLLMMNGELVQDKTKDSLFNAARRVGSLAPTDRAAVEVAYLTVLTRRPTADESTHFETRLAGTRGDERSQRMTDFFWSLLNATEFSWNH